MKIFLVDDQQLFLAGLTMVLQSQDDFDIVGEAHDGFAALQAIPPVQPDVVLMDIRMPRLDGLQCTRKLRALYEDSGKVAPRILILTTLETAESAQQALEVGADGFMVKNAEPDLLIAAVRALGKGTRVFAAPHLPKTNRQELPADFLTLTDRERDVFVSLSHGLNNREIADSLSLSEATVKTHISAILSKLNLRDRVQMVVYAYHNGIIDS